MPSSAKPKKPVLDRAGRTAEEVASRQARRARIRSAAKAPGNLDRKFRTTTARTVSGSPYSKPGRSFLPFVIAAGLLTLFGQVIKSKGKKVAWTKTVVGAVVLLFFLTLLNEASPQLATAFAVLILIRALLVHGPTVFGALTP